MSTNTHSAQRAKAWEQLQCAELAKDYSTHAKIQHRRHNLQATTTIKNLPRKCENLCCTTCDDTIINTTGINTLLSHKTLPDRTIYPREDIQTISATDYAVIDEDEEIIADIITKDCLNCVNDIDAAAATTTTTSTSTSTSTSNCVNRTCPLEGRTSLAAYPILNGHYQLNSHHLARDMDCSSGSGSGGGSICGKSSSSGSRSSSNISSPSASTVSTPLSTPTRLTPHHHQHQHHNQHQHQYSHSHLRHHHPHTLYTQQHEQHQQLQNIMTNNTTTATTTANTTTNTRTTTTANCINLGAAAGSAPTVNTITTTSVNLMSRETNMSKQQLQQHQNQHQHQQQQQRIHYLNRSSTTTSMNNNNNNNVSKKQQKFDPRIGPSPYRQLLPIALCILSFAGVFTLLIFHMDMTGELCYYIY